MHERYISEGAAENEANNPIVNNVKYLDNLLYAFFSHPTALTRPRVWLGHFYEFDPHQYQKLLFKTLIKDEGFKRTPFQVVFEGQTAGLIKGLDDYTKTKYSLDESIDEAHVRFYDDGTISCELEQDRFRSGHYKGTNLDGSRYLEEVVQRNHTLTSDQKHEILSQIEFRDYSETCLATESNGRYRTYTGNVAFVIGCATLTAACCFREIVEPIFVIGANAFVLCCAVDAIIHRSKAQGAGAQQERE